MLYSWCLSYFCSQHCGLPNQFDQREKEITWKNFQQLIQDDKIESVEVNQNKSVPTGRVEITLKGDDDSDKIRYLYVSDVNEIQDYLKEQNVEYTMPDIPQDSWAATTFLPVILLHWAEFSCSSV